MVNGYKKEIVSEIATQLLPTVYDKAVDSFKDSGIAHYEGCKDDAIYGSFKLVEANYAYQEKYIVISVAIDN